MNRPTATVLPRPGPLLGDYPMRRDTPRAPWAGWWPRVAVVRPDPGPRLAAVRTQQARWAALSELEFHAHLRRLRGRLARDGFGGAHRVRALGCVAAVAQRVLGRNPYDSQLRCAEALLDDQLAEMATGEGKTLAAALAAAVAALAGVPVHVMTANDYLAARDAAQLGHLYAALGLRTGVVLGGTAPDERRAAYACDLTYATAREIAFDHLRDRAHLTAQGSALQRCAARLAGDAPPPLLLRGLCMAIVDEADSLLVDEATMPLVLAETQDDPGHRAACFQALVLARRLLPGEHVQLDAERLSVGWTDAGAEHLEAMAEGLGGAWLNRRHRQDLVGAALVALHGLVRDRHYLVREARVELLDAVTGRAAPGRVWARGLQTLVELKEGCPVTPPTRTSAQTSYQRFFLRYLRLSGISGTLAECRAELWAVYGRRTVAVPLRCPSQRVLHAPRVFATGRARAEAVPARVQALLAEGRPVLVGVDSVAEAQALSGLLQAAGIDHQVLDAQHDADEAATVAMAGQAGTVTVATRMAGRGTDIELGADVAARGGLHVLCCQDNPSARLDRQLVGRAARQGDPGSAEVWHALDASIWQSAGPSVGLLRRRQPDEHGALHVPAALVSAWTRRLQGQHQEQGMRQRRRLLEQDRTWQTPLESTQLHA
ncbi:DEAD/DEAH box helicase [Sphaerotilus sp.]|uniref:preprotein translocase subunit SecA n=1 Tax=Sphaerotilus sp. TaxID=2093942 RepID=UPI002ACD8CEB|nr:DEAD/DEAH box helicase [Sphaerotilus sp.]MDZ7854884.1 prepilin peptidase [Sphaerotilus sp.]